MIGFSEILSLVLKNMFEKKSRVFLTISGIVIGIFTFTFFIFVSQGLTNAIQGQFSSFGVNVVIVQSSENSAGTGPPQGTGLTDTDVSKIKQVVKGYKYVAPFIFNTTQFEFGREKEVITTLAYPSRYWSDVTEDLGLEVEKGRNLKEGDKKVLLIGSKTASDAFKKEIKVGNALKYNNQNYRIIGIIKERGDLFVDNAIITSFDDIKEISGQDTYSGIRASFYEGVDSSIQEKAILRKLNPNGKEKRVQTTTPQQVIERFNQILGVLTLIISFISSIALLVGGINVMNTMYSNVLERKNEISVLKALGATNKEVLKIFLVESSIFGFIGSLIGFFGSYILAKILSTIITSIGYNVPVYFDFMFLVEVVLVTSFFAMIFGTYPAWKGAQIDPADNLRDE